VRLRARVGVFRTDCLTSGPRTTPSRTSGAYRLSVTDLDKLVRRLRGLTPRAWQAHDRAGVVRRLANELVAIGGEGHQLPDLPDYVLADVIAVVGADALAKDEAATSKLLAAALDQTR